MQVSPADLDLITRTVIGEADNQPPEGQAAVAHVILNRLTSGKYGKTASDVVLAPKQFEPWQTKSQKLLSYDVNDPAYQRSAKIVNGAVAGDIPDPTGGATHFMNRDEVAKRNGGNVPQKWARGDPLAVIGNHSFYAPGGAVAQASAPDLLGSWGKADAPQSAKPAEIMQPAPDILGAWQIAGPSADAPAKPSTRPQPSGDETPAQYATRLAATEGDTWADTGKRVAGNVLKGFNTVPATIAQGIAATGDAGANKLAQLGVISPESAAKVSDWRGNVNSQISADNAAYNKTVGDDTAAGVANIGGQLIATAPAMAIGSGIAAASKGLPLIQQIVSRAPQLVKTILGGAGVGAGASALTSSSSDAPLSEQMATGGAVGGVLGPLGRMVTKAGSGILGGTVDKETAQLAQAARDKYGINVTAGQISANPMARFADSVLQRLPFTGYGARTAEQQTALNRALATEMGADTDKITPKVIGDNLKDLGKTYDKLNAGIGDVALDKSFVKELTNIRTNAQFNLEPKVAARIDDHLKNIFSKIEPNVSGNGAPLTINAENYQYLTRKDGPLGKALSGSDSGIREYAGEIKGALEKLVGRNDPVYKAAKDATDYKYFVTKSLEDLAHQSPTGDIAPAKILKALDNSTTSAGEIGRIARRFMVEPPSSGTSERLLTMKALATAAGAAGIGGAYAFDPENFQRNLAIGGSAMLAARAGSAALRSNPLATLMIRNGLRPAGPGGNIGVGIPSVAALSAPRTLPEPYAAQ